MAGIYFRRQEWVDEGHQTILQEMQFRIHGKSRKFGIEITQKLIVCLTDVLCVPGINTDIQSPTSRFIIRTERSTKSIF